MSLPETTARLVDAFAGAGRGTVLVLGEVEGAVLIGDRGRIGDVEFEVTGLEAIRFAGADEFPPDTIGILVDHPDSDALKAQIGARVRFGPPGTG